MKKPIIVIVAIVVGIIATNSFMDQSKTAQSNVVEDKIETSQAAARQVNGNIPH